MATINLYENNAGRLFAGTDGGPYWDVTNSAEFDDDATAIGSENTADWTIERYNDIDGDDLGNLVATWEDGTVTIVRQLGLAARRYING